MEIVVEFFIQNMQLLKKCNINAAFFVDLFTNRLYYL